MEKNRSSLVDALPGLVWTARPDGYTDFTNQRWRDYTGLSFEETLGQGWLAAIHPEDLHDLLANWSGILASGETGEAEARLRRFDGVYKWFNFSAAPLSDASGEISQWCGINTDIEDRRQAEEALRAEGQRFHAIVDGLPAVVVLMKPDGQFEHANRHMLDYLGATLEELKGRAFDFNWRFSFHPDDREEVLSRWIRCVETGAPYDHEGRLRRADGVYRWFHIQGFPLRDEQGRIVVWYLLQTDVDDRKRAEKLLEGERRLLETIAKGEPLSTPLSELCLLVEDLCASCVSCSILLLDSDTQRLWHAASPSVPQVYTAAIDGFLIGPEVSACGTAAYHRRQVIADDIASDLRWTQFRDIALANGLKACWSTPILSQDGGVLGTFAMFSAEPGSPSAYDQDVIAQVTHLASIAIERERSQQSLTRALTELRGSEGRLRTIIDTIPAAVCRSRADGSGEFWNQRWHDYAGALPKGAQEAGWYAIAHPQDMAKVAAAWDSAIAEGRAGEVEARLRRFDGVYRWFLCRFEPLRDTAGVIVNWYGANTDIDDAKRAEALLAEEKRLLEMVASGSSLPAILDALCELVEATAQGCHCSVVLVDPLGKRLTDGAAPSLPPSFIDAIIGRPVNVDSGPCAMAACLNEQVIATDLASETRWADYEWCPLALAHGLRSCWSTPISSADGEVMGAFAVYYDEPRTPAAQDQALVSQITHIASIAIKRAQGEAALRRSEGFLAQAQHLSSTCSFYWSVATEEIAWSEEAYNLFEFDRAQPVTNELVFSRIHPEDAPVIFEMMDRGRAGAVVDFEYDHRLLMPDGRVKYVTMVCHGTPDKTGRLEFIAAVQDVTERRASDEALETVRSELARVARVTSLGVLAASIAHEVNQPLSGIVTNASTCLRMLAADPPNVEGARETARRTIRDGNRAADIVSSLRALSINKDVTIEPLDLNEAAREVIALSSSELQRGQILFRSELAEDLPPVIGDRIQLQQVILNLLLNASEAMKAVEDRPRRLVLRTERGDVDEDDVRLSVQDAGVGIDPQSLTKLFEAFYTTKSGGTGIGLSVSRSIIERHRGRLWVTPNDGPGVTFSFSIPGQPEPGDDFRGLAARRPARDMEAQRAMSSQSG